MNRNNKKSYYKGLITGVVLCVLIIGVMTLSGCFLGAYVPSAVKENSQEAEGGRSEKLSERYDEIEEKLDTLQKVVDQYYLSDEEIDTDEMIEGIYKGYIDSLGEAYTVYYTKEEYDQLKESTSGKYSGIGVVVSQNIDTGVITVVRPFAGSPGAEAGILKDDIIYKVAGKEVTGEDVSEVVTWIKGEEGTTVTIEVYRPSEDQYMTFEVERRTIEVPMVEYRMLEDNIGYVSIYEFEETTSEQFNEAVDDLTEQGMQGLIIDLRDNPGGLVNSATAVLDRILPKDKLLVYTIDKDGKKDEEYTKDDETIDLPITVLINENSASASEIVSGCLQDYERAILVGTTSFGKGIVQYVLPLNDGSAIKLTSAKYYTPNGRNIHGIGIEPDVEAELDKNSETDTQLEKAQEITLEHISQ
ncbi:MAG: S41 family peptidase [Coprococcus sp.]